MKKINNKIIMDSFTYDPKLENQKEFFNRMKKINEDLRKENYNIALEFMNKWFEVEVEFNSLSDFKNISEDSLFKNAKKNRKLLKEYCPIFKEKFNIDTNINKDTKKNDIPPTAIQRIANKILEHINFKFIRTTIKNNGFYTIKIK
jgi:hypothetical protein